MSAPKVSLVVRSPGKFEGKQFEFDKPARCLIGRVRGSLVAIPDDDDFLDISRQQCELEIDPPRIRIRDLGSRNGTFVNDELIGQRAEGSEPAATICEDIPFRDLSDADKVRLGGSITLEVHIEPDAVAEVDLGSRPTALHVSETAGDLQSVAKSCQVPTSLRHLAVQDDPCLFAQGPP